MVRFMKITNINQIHTVLATIDNCKGDVQLRFNNGDWFSLKSRFSRYVAMDALIRDCNEELELYCCNQQDEEYLYKILQG